MSHTGSNHRAPSAMELEGMISQLQEQIMMLELWNNVQGLKIKKPKPFDGTWSKLWGFITQLEQYLCMESRQIMTHTDKVLFVSTYLIRPAFDWFEPTLRDYMQHKNEQQQDMDTWEVFADFNEFKRCLERTFGDLDEAQNTKCDLEQLR